MASRAKGTPWAERILVALILASLAGALFLTISVYRRALDAPAPIATEPSIAVEALEPEPQPEVEAEPEPPAPRVAEAEPEPSPPEPVAPPAPMEDPTEKALAELSEATAREIAETKRLDQRLRELEAAKRNAIAQSDKWRRRDMLVKRQVAEMAARADSIDRQADQYAAERDVLARERDALKAAHAKADGRGSYAVLPYKGENGTWRRPIVMECSNGTVAIRPNGPTFNMLDLSSLVNPRSSPVVAAIARELLKVQSSDSPDGAPVVPYFVFLVRPDGIRPYYEARARLEPLGIAFGYELIDQDLKVDVPDYDDLATWDGSPGTELPPLSALAGGSFSGGGSGETSGSDGESPDSGLTWPGAPRGAAADRRGSGSESESGLIAGAFDSATGRRSGGTRGGGDGEGDGDSPDDFIWSGAPGRLFRGGDSSAGSSPSEAADLPPMGGSALPGLGRQSGDGAAQDGRSDSNGRFRDGSADLPGGSSPDGLGRQPGTGAGSRNRGLASAVDALPDFEPAEDGASPQPGERGGSGLGSPSNPGAGFGSETNPGAPRSGGLGGDAKAGDGEGEREGDKSGEGRAPSDKANLVGLESSPATKPGADGSPSPTTNPPGAAGLMWGDGPSLAAGTASETGVGTRASTRTGSGTGTGAQSRSGAEAGSSPGGGSSSSSPSLASSAGGSANGAGPQPLITLGLDGERDPKGGVPGGGPPPPGLGVGLDSLADLAGLLGAGASGGGSGAMGGGSGLMLGGDGETSSKSNGDPSATGDELEAALAKAKRRTSDEPASVIDVPFNITIVCASDGVTIQPGGYRITTSALREGRADKLLARHLASTVRRRAQVDPNIKPRPRVKFLVERDGGSTFWEAREQLFFADLNWPMSLQVAGGQSPRLFDWEAWR